MRALPALAAAALCACSGARTPPARQRPCDALPLLGQTELAALASDAAGGLALVGSLQAPPLRVATAVSDAAGGFLLRTDPEARVSFLHGFGAARPLAAALAPDGSAVVVGSAGRRCFAARLDAQGREAWSSQLLGEGESICRAVAIDERTSDVWAAGEFSGAVGGVRSAGRSDALVLKIAFSSGEMRLARAFGGAGAETADAIAVTGSGMVVVAGTFGAGVPEAASAVDFGRGPVAGAGDADGYLMSLDPERFATRWVSTAAEHGDDAIAAVAVREGRVYAAANLHRERPGAPCGGEVALLRNAEWVRVAEEDCLAARGLIFDEAGRLWSLENAGRGIRARAFSPEDGEGIGVRSWAAERTAMRGIGIAPIPGGFAVAGTTSGETVLCGKPIGSPGEQTGFLTWVRDLGF
jgi:hypothetical protein